MSVNRKAGGAWKETRHDKWYTLAKEQGFRSRAAFKLIQLNQKYDLLSSARAVLDLGAAPGGWLQVCLKYMPVSSMILGVDLVPIKPMRGVTTIQADLTTPECRTLIKKELQGWDVDLVLHDGAPNVAGGMVWSKDAYQQNELVIHALRLATHFMRPDAAFITKVFRSQDYNALLWVLQQLFRSVDVTKPLASRNASAEIFVVCRHYLAPKSIDPFLLDPAHVFQQFDVQRPPVDVFAKAAGKQTRSREGYSDAEMNGLIGVRCDVMTFIDAEEPIVTLGSYHAFTFTSDAAQTLLRSANTTAEIRALCEDLKVLGKGDFKALLRWRKRMRDFAKELKEEALKDERQASGDSGEAEAPEEEAKSEEQLAEEEEAAMTAALHDLKARQLHRVRVDKRKKHARKQRATQRLLLNKNSLTDVQEITGADPNDELFSLSAVTGHTLDVLEAHAGEELDEEHEEEEEEDEEEGAEGKGEEEGSEDEDAYIAQLERNLDSMYDAYKERRQMVERIKEKGDEEMRQAEAAEREAAADLHDEEDDDDVSDEELYAQMKVGSKRKRAALEAGEDDEEAKASNPLVVSLEEQERISAAKRAERWFQRDVFTSALAPEKPAGEEEKEEEAEEEEGERPRHVRATGRTTLTDLLTPAVLTDSSDDDEEEEDEDEPSRWLGGDDEDAEDEPRLTRKQREEQRRLNPPVKDRRLPGLDALSKTREQVDEDIKKRDKRAKKNVREERRLQRKAEREAATTTPSASSPADAIEDDDDDAHLLVDADSAKKAKRMSKRAAKQAGLSTSTAASADFEEVAAAPDFSSDDDAVATTLALGTRMLQKRQRTALLDSSYNRYAVDLSERSGLPSWFQAEEAIHSTAQLPVTKDEVSAFKDRLKLINARPIKKIAEARLRKKAKTEKRWQRIAAKVDDVAQEEGGSTGDKVRRMEALMRKKDKRSIRGDRKYFVTRKGGGIDEVRRKKGSKKTGGLSVQVDKRLKKDKRGRKVADKHSNKRSSTTNKRRRGT